MVAYYCSFDLKRNYGCGYDDDGDGDDAGGGNYDDDIDDAERNAVYHFRYQYWNLLYHY